MASTRHSSESCMIYTLPLIISLMIQVPLTVISFSADSDVTQWYVVDDGVMGGKSNGEFSLNSEGNAVFSGTISLENNGGFSSIRHRVELSKLESYTKVVLKVRGDGKRYQFRVKSDPTQDYSYVAEFSTSGDWEDIEIPFGKLRPAFRGNALDRPNYPGETMGEIGFLFGNKKAEAFKLMINSIELQ